MIGKLLFVWLTLYVSVLQAGTGNQEQTDNVFGNDRREAVTSRRYPWSTVGYLPTGCTGTLVGRNLVLTAAHCVLDGTTGKLSPSLTHFEPNRIDGKATDYVGIEHAWWGTSDPDKFRGSDWAILKLTKNTGDTYGWMGVENAVSDSVTSVGYSGNFRDGRTAGAHVGCSIREKSGDLLYHDCHTARGSSGGPMFVMRGESAYIVALNVAEYRLGGDSSLYVSDYSRTFANVAIPASPFFSKLRELKGE